MYSFHKCLFLNASEVEYFGLVFPDVGLDTNIYYKACNDLIRRKNEFFQNAKDGEKTYYTLEKCGKEEVRRYVEMEFFDWCCLDSHTNSIDLLNKRFIKQHILLCNDIFERSLATVHHHQKAFYIDVLQR